MLIGFRAWPIQREDTGRLVAQPKIREGALEGLLSEADPLQVALSDPFEVEHVREELHYLVGLAGRHGEMRYQPGINTAGCAWDPDHFPPVDHGKPYDPGCGFYAFKRLPRALAQAEILGPMGSGVPSWRLRAGTCHCAIVGMVGLGGPGQGAVLEATEGWRARQAAPMALLATPEWRQQSCNRLVTAHGDDYSAVYVEEQGHAGDHVAPLAAHYRIPAFGSVAELEAYAARYQEQPPSWPTEELPRAHRLPGLQRLAQAAAELAAAAAQALEDRNGGIRGSLHTARPSSQQFQPGGYVRSPSSPPGPLATYRTSGGRITTGPGGGPPYSWQEAMRQLGSQPYRWGAVGPRGGFTTGQGHGQDQSRPTRPEPRRRGPWWGNGKPPPGAGPRRPGRGD